MSDDPCPDAFRQHIERARAGDDAAFAELWRWLHPSLVRWLRVVAREHVEDVESEVWLSVARGLDCFVGGSAEFRAWVFTIARRRSIDFARRRLRRPPMASLSGIDVVDPSAASTSAVDDAAALGAALALLEGLTPDQREVVALRVIVGLSVGETAEVVNRSEASVRVLCHRGLRTLARLLDARSREDVPA